MAAGPLVYESVGGLKREEDTVLVLGCLGWLPRRHQDGCAV